MVDYGCSRFVIRDNQNGIIYTSDYVLDEMITGEKSSYLI